MEQCTRSGWKDGRELGKLIVEIIFGVLIAGVGSYSIWAAVRGLIEGVYQRFSNIMDGKEIEEKNIYEAYARSAFPAGGRTAAFLLDMAHKGYIKIRRVGDDIFIDEAGPVDESDKWTKELFDKLFMGDLEMATNFSARYSRSVNWRKACLRFFKHSQVIIDEAKKNTFTGDDYWGLGYSKTTYLQMILWGLFCLYMGVCGSMSLSLNILSVLILFGAGVGLVLLAKAVKACANLVGQSEPGFLEGMIRRNPETGILSVVIFGFFADLVFVIMKVLSFIQDNSYDVDIYIAVIALIAMVMMIWNDTRNQAALKNAEYLRDLVTVRFDKEYSDNKAIDMASLERLQILKYMVKPEKKPKVKDEMKLLEMYEAPTWYDGYGYKGLSTLMEELNAITDDCLKNG